jgi:Tol biopolymer transport system component
MAVRFDNTKLQVIGDPVQVLSGVRGTLSGSVDYAVSENGTLVYVPAGVEGLRLHEHSLVWVDRQGTETPLMQEKRDFAAPRISPDGKQVAVNVRDDANTLSRQVWIYDLEDDSFNRLTFGEENSAAAAWSPDSKWLVFQSGGLGENGMVKQPADRSSPPERLTSTPNRQMPSSWSSDGRFLAFSENPRNNVDIGVLPMEEDGEPEYIVTSPDAEKYPRFSPDGKWLAYVSDELGQNNVYVRPFPEPDVKWLISDQEAGGAEPVWSPDGKELFYRSGDEMIAVSIQATDQTLNVGKSTVLFEGPYASHSAPSGYQYYDVSPDGKRFLMTKEETTRQPGQINVVLNWFEELKRLVPTDN